MNRDRECEDCGDPCCGCYAAGAADRTEKIVAWCRKQAASERVQRLFDFGATEKAYLALAAEIETVDFDDR